MKVYVYQDKGPLQRTCLRSVSFQFGILRTYCCVKNWEKKNPTNNPKQLPNKVLGNILGNIMVTMHFCFDKAMSDFPLKGGAERIQNTPFETSQKVSSEFCKTN